MENFYYVGTVQYNGKKVQYNGKLLLCILTVELSDGPLVPVQYGGEDKGDAQHHTGQQDQGHQGLLGSGYEAPLKHSTHISIIRRWVASICIQV